MPRAQTSEPEEYFALYIRPAHAIAHTASIVMEYHGGQYCADVLELIDTLHLVPCARYRDLVLYAPSRLRNIPVARARSPEHLFQKLIYRLSMSQSAQSQDQPPAFVIAGVDAQPLSTLSEAYDEFFHVAEQEPGVTLK